MRRRFWGVGLAVAAVLSALAGSQGGARAGAELALNPTQQENRLPGSIGWLQSVNAPRGAIEGYASEASVLPGQVTHFHVSTRPAARYGVEIYRVGYYGGKGGRLIACTPNCKAQRRGVARPIPNPHPTTGYLDAGWPVTDTWRVPKNAVSGYYLARLVLLSGPYAHKAQAISFVVRERPGRRSTILVQASDNTAQAYNSWGGKSLYRFNSTGGVKATHVSFNRPYILSVPPPADEYPLTRFLEQHGYDVSYTTDVDTDRDPAELRRHRLVIVNGHDEYWSRRMRDGFEAARDAGTNLAFIGGDIASWQMRYEDDRRTVVVYKPPEVDPEPNELLKTGSFKDLGRPECSLLGVMFTGAHERISSYSINDEALNDPWFKGTGFKAGSRITGNNYEWDSVVPGCNKDPLTVFWSRTGGPGHSSAVRYTAPSGALVFSAGSFVFNLFALTGNYNAVPPSQHGADLRLQRFMQNALADLTRKRPVA